MRSEIEGSDDGPAPSSESGEVGQCVIAEEASEAAPISPLIDQLAELQYRRKFYIKMTNKQTNATGALVRRALGWRYDMEEDDQKNLNNRAAKLVSAALAGKEPDAEDVDLVNTLVLEFEVTALAIKPLRDRRAIVEKQMKQIARQLPVYEWAKGIRGFGELGLAVLVAEAGDPTRFAGKDRLFKRLGLSPHGGKAYSTWRKTGGLTSEDWVAAGYSPRRRAEIFAVIGDPLFKQQSVVKGPYREAYDRRREVTDRTHPDWTKGHSHADGLRVMTKHLIRDFRVAWRRVMHESPEGGHSKSARREVSEREASMKSPEGVTARVPTARKAKRRKIGTVTPSGASHASPSD